MASPDQDQIKLLGSPGTNKLILLVPNMQALSGFPFLGLILDVPDIFDENWWNWCSPTPNHCFEAIPFHKHPSSKWYKHSSCYLSIIFISHWKKPMCIMNDQLVRKRLQDCSMEYCSTINTYKIECQRITVADMLIVFHMENQGFITGTANSYFRSRCNLWAQRQGEYLELWQIQSQPPSKNIKTNTLQNKINIKQWSIHFGYNMDTPNKVIC